MRGRRGPGRGCPESSPGSPPADVVLFSPRRVFFLNVPFDSVIERLTLRRVDPVTGERFVPGPGGWPSEGPGAPALLGSLPRPSS